MPEIDPRLTRGLDALSEQRTEVTEYLNWYRGDHPRPYIPPKAAAEYRRIVDIASSAWLKLVIDAINERLKVDGFTGQGDADTDLEAWRIWQANRMNAVQVLVHAEALTLGRSYVSVWPNLSDRSTPILRGESARRVWVARDSTDFRPLWAVKSWTTGDEGPAPGSQVAYLYDPEQFQVYRRADKSGEWKPDGPPRPNLLRRVPFVEFANGRDLLGETTSELAPLIPIQERINSTNLHMQLAMLVAAFKQRWAAGLVIPEDENGNPVEPFNAAVDKLWISDNPDAKFGEFSESNLANYVAVLESLVRQLSAISAVPAHYLLGQMVNISAEALKAAEAGLSAKVRHKQLVLGEGWSEVMDLVQAAGGRVAAPLEPHWADTEARSEAQLVDALTKLGAPPIGIPQEALWERYGVSPPVIQRWKDMQADAARRAAGAEVAGVLAARFGADTGPADTPPAAPAAAEAA